MRVCERGQCMKFAIEKIGKIVPLYAVIPLISAVVFNFAIYVGANILVGDLPHIDISSEIDKQIPFCAPFILFYVLAYIQWIMGYIVISHHSKEYCVKVAIADIIAKAISFLFFVFFPTTLVRPEISGNGIFELITKGIYAADPPTNLFPSIHCLESWVVFRCALKLKLPTVYKVLMGAFSVGVFASVVLVKQHVLIDIPAGILIFEISYLITHLSGIHKPIAKLLPPRGAVNQS